MSLPIEQQSPAVTGMEEHSSHGSIGPVIGVLVVIIVFAVVAVMIGRLCSGKSIMGYGHFDLESWAESKCSSCIDGRITPPPPANAIRPRANISAASLPIPMPVQLQTQQDESSSSQTPPANA